MVPHNLSAMISTVTSDWIWYMLKTVAQQTILNIWIATWILIRLHHWKEGVHIIFEKGQDLEGFIGQKAEMDTTLKGNFHLCKIA